MRSEVASNIIWFPDSFNLHNLPISRILFYIVKLVSGIQKGVLSSDVNISGSCTGRKPWRNTQMYTYECSGENNYIKWSNNLGTGDFIIESTFNVPSIPSTGLRFVFYAGHIEKVFGLNDGNRDLFYAGGLMRLLMCFRRCWKMDTKRENWYQLEIIGKASVVMWNAMMMISEKSQIVLNWIGFQAIATTLATKIGVLVNIQNKRADNNWHDHKLYLYLTFFILEFLEVSLPDFSLAYSLIF